MPMTSIGTRASTSIITLAVVAAAAVVAVAALVGVVTVVATAADGVAAPRLSNRCYMYMLLMPQMPELAV